MPHTPENSEHSLKLENGIIISVLTSNVKNYVHEIKLNHHKPKKKKYCFLCRSQTNSLLLILGTYVTIFSIASIILVMSVLRLQNGNESEKLTLNVNANEEMHKAKYDFTLKKVNNLLPRRLFKEFLWPFKSSVFNCSSLSDVKKFNFLTSGWTKNVFSFEYNNKNYALKTVNMNGSDMKNCKEKHTTKLCFEKASSKMYKEYILSNELSHINIIKVLAWCVSSNNYLNDVAIVTELCSPIDIISLLRMSFQQRLKVMLDLSQLMVYLADSPLGSVAINDFQRQQFVMCGDTLKLTDLDDLSIEEPKCSSQIQCSQEKLTQHMRLNENHTDNIIDCINNFCLGYNEKQNVVNTYKHFVNLFLNITAPIWLYKDIETLFITYISSWNAKAVLKETELLYVKYNSLKMN